MQGPVVHGGEVERRRVTVGQIDGTWVDLGTAAGAQRLGLRRAVLEPGGRSTPVHVHSGEEEIVLVLDGAGVSWQNGETFEIAAGDCVVHVVSGPAHTLLAGPGGMTVLIFGERADSEACYLPRANVSWLGESWVKAGDTPHPFAQEAAAGPLEPGEPSRRPASIVNLSDVAAVEVDRGDTGLASQDLGRAAGSRRTGLRRVALAPGRCSYPPHCHASEEELYVVLEGSGEYLLHDQATPGEWRPVAHPVAAGDVISVPAGTGLAHTFRAGSDGLVFLAYGQRNGGDVRWYPRSRKLSFSGLRLVGRFEPAGYWEGEEPPAG